MGWENLKSKIPGSRSHNQEAKHNSAEAECLSQMKSELSQMKIELDSVRESLSDVHTELNTVRQEVKTALDQLNDYQKQLAKIVADLLASSGDLGGKTGSRKSSSSGTQGHDLEFDELKLMMNSLSETLHKKVHEFENRLLHDFAQLETFVKEASKGNHHSKDGDPIASIRALNKKVDTVVQSLDGESKLTRIGTPVSNDTVDSSVHIKRSKSRHASRTSRHSDGSTPSRESTKTSSVLDWVSMLQTHQSSI